jgi:hypothetical protein
MKDKNSKSKILLCNENTSSIFFFEKLLPSLRIKTPTLLRGFFYNGKCECAIAFIKVQTYLNVRKIQKLGPKLRQIGMSLVP